MTEQSTRAVKPIDSLRQTFNSSAMRDQLRAALPPHISVEKFIRVTLSLLQNNPKLVACERNSLFSAVMTIAQLGLMPDAILGEAYVAEYKGKAAVIIGYRGLMKLSRQSGEVKSIYAELIHANDTFEYIAGTDRKLIHKPMWGADPGPIIGVYAVAELNDGFIQFEVMSIAEVEHIRKTVASQNSAAWNGIGYPEMVRKTVLRRLLKYLPMTVDPAAFSDGETQDTPAQPLLPGGTTVSLPTTGTRRSRLTQLAAQDAPASPEEPPPSDDPFGEEVDPETGEVLQGGRVSDM